MKRIKVEKYKPVFEGKLFTIQQAKATLPNGKTEIFERACREPTVTILAIDSKKRLLLNYEYRTHLKKYIWRLPTGRVNKNEKPKQAARRELMEEAGFDAKNLTLFGKSIAGQSYHRIHYVYLATNLIPKRINADEGEDITIKPTTIQKAYKMVIKEQIKEQDIAYSICRLYWNRKKFLK